MQVPSSYKDGAEVKAGDLLTVRVCPFGDDKFLYVSCWGTGEMRQYNVSDPFNPRHTGSVHLGGIVRKTLHPRSGPLNGAPHIRGNPVAEKTPSRLLVNRATRPTR